MFLLNISQVHQPNYNSINSKKKKKIDISNQPKPPSLEQPATPWEKTGKKKNQLLKKCKHQNATEKKICIKYRAIRMGKEKY